jgi:hypothetical protein
MGIKCWYGGDHHQNSLTVLLISDFFYGYSSYSALYVCLESGMPGTQLVLLVLSAQNRGPYDGLYYIKSNLK